MWLEWDRGTYPDAVWWAFVTIAAVGYGDYSPITGLGQSMAIILMFFGLGVIGVLSSYLASTFISLENRRESKPVSANTQAEEETRINLEDKLAAIKDE